MSKAAWTYIWSVFVTALALSTVMLFTTTQREPDWFTFGVLVVFATVAQLFEAKHDKQSYYPHFVFFFAGVVLLPSFYIALLIAIPHLLEWAKDRITNGKHRRPWYIQPFNICAHIIPAIGAHWLYILIVDNLPDLSGLTLLLALVSAVSAYVGLNHVLVGQALLMARGVSYQKSGVFSRESLMPDFIMSMLGFVAAHAWFINPWLALPALSPLLLMYQALMVPQLKQDAQTDGKTGLWNARHFTALYQAEMERAKRFARPLSFIMADLDLLRNINNTYGHLAGDTVLAGIGRILRENVREYDMAGRFGGEEFAIALPETGAREAKAIAERLREAVAAAEFEVSTTSKPIKVTMSLGVASFPEDAFTSNELVHEADIAVYQAKLNGRNCVVASGDVPHHVKLGIAPVNDRLTSPFVPTFVPRPSQVDDAVQQVTGDPHPTNSDPASDAAAPVLATGAKVGALSTDQGEAPYVAAPIMVETPRELQTDGVVPQSAHDRRTKGEAPRKEERRQRAKVAAQYKSKKGGEVVGAEGGPSPILPFYVGSVVILAVISLLISLFLDQKHDLLAIALLTVIAAAAELLQIDAYGDNTVSVTVGLSFAAALVAGVPGVAAVSLAIALVHYVQKRPDFYKTAFNWSNHLLAGLMPTATIAFLDTLMGREAINVYDLPMLAAPLVMAAFAYYVVETGLITGAISLAKRANPLEIWRAQFQWLATHYLVLSLLGVFLAIAYSALGTMGVLVFVMPVLMMRFSQKQYVDKTESSMRELRRMNEQLRLANEEVLNAHRAMHKFNEELFLTLSTIIDARDPFVGNHAAKVADYATAIATEMDLPPSRIEPLRQAGFLHDVGKLAISEQILHKPAKLTAEEYEIIKTHATLGGEFLEMSQGLRHLAPLVRHHHERWDGGGYPDGQRGEEISIESRILAVCDAAEAMASDRPYRRGMSLDEVIAEVKRCAGTQFDPKVAEAFVRIAEHERERFVVNSAATVLQRQALQRYGHAMPETKEEPQRKQAERVSTPTTVLVGK